MEVRVSGPVRRRSGGRCLIVSILAIVLVMVVISVAAPLLVTGMFLGGGIRLPAALATQVGISPDLLSPDGALLAMHGIETKELEGVDPTRYEPFANYERVRQFAGEGAELVEIRLFGARNDGTLDLKATYSPAPNAEYKFVRRLAQPPPNAPPVGAGGAVTGAWWEPVSVRVYEPGQRRRITSGNSRIDYVNRGMERRPEQATSTAPTTLPAPTCSLLALWQQATIRGAPPDAVARIDYTKDGYSFAIQGTPVNFRLGPDCQPRR
jgi:hypothetical protein